MSRSDGSVGGGLLGALYAVAAVIVGVVRDAWNAATKDGHLAAAWRQGIGELGQALRAFPEAIQVHEPGAIWNPTQGEIAADRRESPVSIRSPGEIAAKARENVSAPEPVQDRQNNLDGGVQGPKQDLGREIDQGHEM